MRSDSVLAGKQVVVMGLGRFGGGVDAVRYAAQQGARVLVTDQAAPETLTESVHQLQDLNNVTFRLGCHEKADFEQADVVIVNPAIADDNIYLQHVRSHGTLVTTQVNLFFQQCPAQIIGITGANGKSTTTALTAFLLAAGCRQDDVGYDRVWRAGNIGHCPLLGLLETIQSRDVVVLELSSFQTERLAAIERGPHVALLTNLTPNHLDRHGTFVEYCRAKEQMFRYQPRDAEHPCISFFNAHDTVGCDWYAAYGEEVGRECRLYDCDTLSDTLRMAYTLPGRANLQNLAAAVAVADHLGVSEDTMAAQLPAFQSLTHRLERVAEVDQVCWYNDSIATTPESAVVALQAFTAPKVIIAGGYDKGVSFTELGRVIAARAKAAVLLGQTAGAIAAAIRTAGGETLPIAQAASLEQAVRHARDFSRPGDVVLLSPACASYDMFDNFQQRGERFRQLVETLVSSA
ncbi:UDP-N-acetylmuramoyl-L-alanine--D-glutamate ligase [Planctomycetota bacterium]